MKKLALLSILTLASLAAHAQTTVVDDHTTTAQFGTQLHHHPLFYGGFIEGAWLNQVGGRDDCGSTSVTSPTVVDQVADYFVGLKVGDKMYTDSLDQTGAEARIVLIVRKLYPCRVAQ
jgi:hypothetical protein